MGHADSIEPALYDAAGLAKGVGEVTRAARREV
jgi:hypothetical protein